MLQFKSDLAKCRTNKQVLDLIKRNGYKVVKDTSEDVGSFSVWIDELTRIYKNSRKEYVLQTWQKVNMSYSGIPTFDPSWQLSR